MYRMTQQHDERLSAGFRALADRARDAAAGERVRQAVLAAASGVERAPARSAVGSWFGWAAAAVLVLSSISGAWLAHRVDRVGTSPVRPAGFVAIPGASVLPPIDSAAIVRVSVPVTALPQYGLPIVADATGETVEADLLIAQDGIPRAIRLTEDSTLTGSTP